MRPQVGFGDPTTGEFGLLMLHNSQSAADLLDTGAEGDVGSLPGGVVRCGDENVEASG